MQNLAYLVVVRFFGGLQSFSRVSSTIDVNKLTTALRYLRLQQTKQTVLWQASRTIITYKIRLTRPIPSSQGNVVCIQLLAERQSRSEPASVCPTLAWLSTADIHTTILKPYSSTLKNNLTLRVN